MLRRRDMDFYDLSVFTDLADNTSRSFFTFMFVPFGLKTVELAHGDRTTQADLSLRRTMS